MLSVGAAVKHIRERLGKTQVEFATMLGCREITVLRWEKEAFKPSGIALIQLINLAEGEEKEPLARLLALDIGTRRVDLRDGTWGEIPGAFRGRSAEAAYEPTEQIDRSHWHTMLDQILDSGQAVAINAIQYVLIVAEDLVRLRAPKARKKRAR